MNLYPRLNPACLFTRKSIFTLGQHAPGAGIKGRRMTLIPSMHMRTLVSLVIFFFHRKNYTKER